MSSPEIDTPSGDSWANIAKSWKLVDITSSWPDICFPDLQLPSSSRLLLPYPFPNWQRGWAPTSRRHGPPEPNAVIQMYIHISSGNIDVRTNSSWNGGAFPPPTFWFSFRATTNLQSAMHLYRPKFSGLKSLKSLLFVVILPQFWVAYNKLRASFNSYGRPRISVLRKAR
jgi:hypothetical protein